VFRSDRTRDIRLRNRSRESLGSARPQPREPTVDKPCRAHAGDELRPQGSEDVRVEGAVSAVLVAHRDPVAAKRIVINHQYDQVRRIVRVGEACHQANLRRRRCVDEPHLVEQRSTRGDSVLPGRDRRAPVLGVCDMQQGHQRTGTS
jgi:hypothetical protein